MNNELLTLEKSSIVGCTCSGSMKAAVCKAPGLYVIETVDMPKCGANDVLIRLKGCGVCSSGIPVWEGRPWFTYPLETGAPGHEGWGIIEGVGSDVKEYTSGQWVVCLSQNAFAEYCVVPESHIALIPQQLEGEYLPGEALGCVINIFNRCEIRRGQNVAVIGAGFIGLALSSLALGFGANVSIVSRNKGALKIAQKMGIEQTVQYDGLSDNLLKIMKGMCQDGYDCVIEATGYQKPLDLASELVKIRGRLVVAGYHQDGVRSVNMQSWNWRGIDVINAHERDYHVCMNGMKAALKAVERKQIDIGTLLTHVYTLDKISDAFNAAKNRQDGFVKAVVII